MDSRNPAHSPRDEAATHERGRRLLAAALTTGRPLPGPVAGAVTTILSAVEAARTALASLPTASDAYRGGALLSVVETYERQLAALVALVVMLDVVDVDEDEAGPLAGSWSHVIGDVLFGFTAAITATGGRQWSVARYDGAPADEVKSPRDWHPVATWAGGSDDVDDDTVSAGFIAAAADAELPYLDDVTIAAIARQVVDHEREADAQALRQIRASRGSWLSGSSSDGPTSTGGAA